jgi:hypothetical protein
MAGHYGYEAREPGATAIRGRGVMANLRWIDLAEALLPGYTFGTWFSLSDTDISPPIVGRHRKEHPHVLIEDYLFGQGEAVRTFFRSTQGGDLAHRAHPPHCAETCKLQDSGWIVIERKSVLAEALKGNFSCTEPYPDVVASLRKAITP